MRRPVLLLGLLAGLVPWYLAAQEKQAAGTPKPAPASQVVPAEVQDMVLLGENRPVLVRLYVRVDGQPFQTVWDQLLHDLFSHFDRDGNGVLSREEAALVPQPQQLLSGSYFLAQPYAYYGNTYRPPGAPPQPEKVTFAEFAAPFQDYRGAFGAFFTVSLNPRASALTENLFARLDRDKDGKLSKEELSQATASLLKLDLDDDEAVTPQEVAANIYQLPMQGPFVQARGRVVQAGPYGQQVSGALPDDSVVSVINTANPPGHLARQLLIRYGSGDMRIRDRKLSREEIGLDREAFDQLDTNKDGVLDADELLRFTERRPDLEIRVRLGKRDQGQPALELVSSREGQTEGIQKTGDGSLVLQLGGKRMELRCKDEGTKQGARSSLQMVANFMNQVQYADSNQDGYLEREELERNNQFQNLLRSFKKLDRDGDGRISVKELLTYVEGLVDLQTRILTNQVSLVISEQEVDLFQLLDTNRDGRLGIRELRNAPRVLAQLDRNGDGQVTRDEIRSGVLVLTQGSPMANPYQGSYPGRMVPYEAYATATQPPPRGPAWFQKMDRNRDGDVSRREWIGSKEEFDRLDLDHDGLISLEEAEKAEGKMTR
jgi:Ca2+-binding EF-hand superfamily protein